MSDKFGIEPLRSGGGEVNVIDLWVLHHNNSEFRVSVQGDRIQIRVVRFDSAREIKIVAHSGDTILLE